MSQLVIENLDVRHGQLKAVRDVSFSLDKGDILALVGANGAGKTTLLRAIAGAHIPHGGKILLDGTDVMQTASHKRVSAGIALVPEGRRLFAQMSLEENLLLGKSSQRAGDWTIERVFEIFPNLIPRRHTKAGNLSGGEQQATAIGRALLSNPDVILLDEVSLGLAPLVVERVYESLNVLMSSGTTILIVEQDLSRAMSVASRVICMLEGSIVLNKLVADVTREEITNAYFGLDKFMPEGGARP